MQINVVKSPKPLLERVKAECLNSKQLLWEMLSREPVVSGPEPSESSKVGRAKLIDRKLISKVQIRTIKNCKKTVSRELISNIPL